MSEEEKIKDYSLGLQLGLILGIYAISLAISIIFIYKVSRKKISKAIFVLSSIYSSLFVYLNLMAIFDLFFNNHEGFHKLFKFLKKFYFGFTIVDKALGFFLFNLLIYYLESGYFSNMKRFSDGLRRFCHSMKKLTCCKIAIILAIAIPIVGTLLVLLIIYRKHYDLGVNPLNYSDILFDCYAVFEIYTGVGFFIYQLIKDCKRIDDENLIKRYYRYSTKIIIEKVNKYIKSINDAYEYLNKLAQIFENDNSNPYHQYLQKYYNKIKQTKLELEGNNNGNKVIIYNNKTNTNTNTNSNYNTNPNNNTNNNVNTNNNANTNNNTNTNNNANTNNNTNTNNKTNANTNINNTNANTNNNTKVNTNDENNESNMYDKSISTGNINNNNSNEEQNYVQKINLPKIPELSTEVYVITNEKQINSTLLEENSDTSEKIRKYKKAVRRLEKLKMLHKELEKETKKDSKKVKKNNCTCGLIILSIAFIIAIATDFVLPLAFEYKSDENYYKNNSDLFDKNESTAVNVITGILGILVAAIFACPYTIITIYTTIRKRYVSGDYLYDKEINDDISLMKSVQLVCGYTFAIVYCNLYFWKTIDYKGKLGKPYFYEKIIIPDYIFKQGISIFMIIKIILIVGSIFANLYLSNLFLFKNDLAEYNLCGDKNCVYDDATIFNKNLEDNFKAVKILGAKNEIISA